MATEEEGHISKDQWLRMEDVKKFLVDSVQREILLYSVNYKTKNTMIISSAFLPKKYADNRYTDDLLQWNFRADQGQWGYGYTITSTGRKKYKIYKPFEGERPDIFSHAIPIIINRDNPFDDEDAKYFEINQQISHIHSLYWVEDLQAYCSLSESGDPQKEIFLDRQETQTSIYASENIIMRHMLFTNLVLVRLFEFNRFTDKDNYDFPQPIHEKRERWGDGIDIHANWTPLGTIGAYIRGFQIARPPQDRRKRQSILSGESKKQYHTFVALDFKHNIVHEVSCDPSKLGNYFVESDYPFETTPVFFNREVLHRYQSNPEKYKVGSRKIECRNAWELQYDINENNQVHVFLIDIGRIPYSEQSYWKTFNEEPIGGISERSYQTDFLGNWYEKHEPLIMLKKLLNTFPTVKTPEGNTPFWQTPSSAESGLMDRVHYLATKSSPEWEGAIASLDRLVVEGINLKHLRKMAKQQGIEDYDKNGSIVLLKKILTKLGFAQDVIEEIFNPLKEMNDLRSKFSSHRKSEDTLKIMKEIKKQHKDLPSHFSNLVDRVLNAMEILQNMVDQHTFDIITK